MHTLPCNLLILACAAVVASASGSCGPQEYRSEAGLCLVCATCPEGELQSSCQPFVDAVCAPTAPLPQGQPPSEAQSLQASVRRAKQLLSVEMTRMENLVYEWQISVFVISIVVTFALVFACLSLLICRSRTVVQKGIEDYGHLLTANNAQRIDVLDQGSLAYADFERTKIGPRSEDSPYGQLSSPTRSKASSRVSANYSRLPQSPV